METSQEEKVVGEGQGAETVVPTVAPEAVVPEVAEVVAEEAPQKKEAGIIIGSIIAGVLLIGGAGYYVYTEHYVDGGTVAVVNGAKIYQKEFGESLALVKQNPALYGIDPAGADTEKQMQDQALEVLVTNMLLITAAEDSGFTVEDAKVEALYTDLLTQLGGEEALKTQMATVGLTDEKLRRNIRERALVDQYLEAETDIENITVTDEEVQEFVTMLTESGVFGSEEGKAVVPKIEEIRPQVEAEIKAQKQQVIINDLLVKLREDATITLKI